MWNISAWSIKQPIPSILLFLVLCLAGTWSFCSLEMDELPNIDVPTVSVAISQSGAAASELELQVTRKVEDAVSGIGRVKHLSSAVTEGSSTTNIEFELGTNTDRAVSDVRDRISRIRATLPAEINEPVIQRVDFAGQAFATYTVFAPNMSDTELSWLVDSDISRALMSVPGVGQVQRAGGVSREIRINLNPEKLESVGLTAEYANEQIRARNVNLPGGRGEIGAKEQTIRTVGGANTIDDLRKLKLNLPNGGWVRLDSIGTVEDSYADRRQFALLNGKPVVAFSLVRSSGSGMAQVAELVDKKLAAIKPSLPAQVQINKVRTTADYVHESFNATLEALLLGAALSVIIIWFFLKDWRSAGISALAMPLSIVPTFLFIKMLGFTLNDMSLLGLALVIGILVDDAIVEIENIVRHIHMGKTPYQAALDAADEIGLAVVATTFSIIAVFVPVALMSGIPGQFFKQFGYTVAIAVFMSLLVARLITPAMAAFWLEVPAEDDRQRTILKGYDAVLSWSLQNRKTTVLLASAFFVMSMALAFVIPQNLIGSADRGETILGVELDPGTSIERTIEVVQKIDRDVRSNPNVDHIFATVGTPSESGSPLKGASAGDVNKAELFIGLKPRLNRIDSQQVVESQLRQYLSSVPGARFKFSSTGGPGGRLEFSLVGSDADELERYSAALIRDMRSIPGLADVQSSASVRSPQIVVKPERELAAEKGITVRSIARTALVATLGDVDPSLGRFDLPDRQINIRVQIDPEFKTDISRIGLLKIGTARGELVPLSSIAKIEECNGPAKIDRYDRQRQVLVSAQLVEGLPLGKALDSIRQLPVYKNKPVSITEAAAGDVELQQEVFQGFNLALCAAVVLMYCVLVLLFNDFVHPLTIMASLPLSVGGAIAALMFTGQPLGMYALIGIVMLMGLVAKNAILLVEYSLEAMKQGASVDAAIKSAGAARMRPILMTTFAMIAGMLPIAAGLGAGAEMRAPMAVAVIGGLTTSSVLTLVVVPVIFSLSYDLRLRIAQKRKNDGPSSVLWTKGNVVSAKSTKN